MELFNLLSDEEKEMINHYIEHYSGGDNYGLKAELSHILRIWDKHKQNLYNLFGQNLILSKDVEFDVPFDSIQRKIREEILYSNGKAQQAYREFNDWCRNNLPWEIAAYRSDIQDLMTAWTLARNSCYTGFPKVILENGKTFSIQKGSKPMKVLTKLNELYHFTSEENLEEFRIIHSQCLNQKKHKGELTLSIHPLDYMTMSDNDYRWSSCMSWKENGCYRRGTVEMMNSPLVIVAYLNGGNNFSIGNYAWSNKKWRQLFIFDPVEKAIISIKGYPYHSTDLIKLTMDWIAELAAENLDIHFDTSHFIDMYNDSGENSELDNSYDFEIYCDYMYNDMNCADAHYAYIVDRDKKYYDINFSGESECMWCGEIDVDWEYMSDEAQDLICPHCDDRNWCDSCERSVSGDVVYINGSSYCEHCFYEYITKEFVTDELTYTGNIISVPVLNKNEKAELAFYLHTADLEKARRVINSVDRIISIDRDYIQMAYPWGETKSLPNNIFNFEDARVLEIERIWSGTYKYPYLFESDFTEEGLEKLNDYSTELDFYDYL